MPTLKVLRSRLRPLPVPVPVPVWPDSDECAVPMAKRARVSESVSEQIQENMLHFGPVLLSVMVLLLRSSVDP